MNKYDILAILTVIILVFLGTFTILAHYDKVGNKIKQINNEVNTLIIQRENLSEEINALLEGE